MLNESSVQSMSCFMQKGVFERVASTGRIAHSELSVSVLSATYSHVCTLQKVLKDIVNETIY